MSDLEVLEHLSGHGRGDADHGGDAEDGGDSADPVAPTRTMSRAAMISVDKVRPEIGLLEEPIWPTRFPETAAKKNPARP